MKVEYNEDGLADVYVCADEMSIAEVAWMGCESDNPVPEGLIGFCPIFSSEEHAKAWRPDADILVRVKYEPEE